jgi:sugar lactone lactonase YvrE
MTAAVDARDSTIALTLATSDGRERLLTASCFDVGATHAEGPAWLQGAGKLALIDMAAPVLLLLEPRSGAVERIELSEPGSAAVPLDDATVLVPGGRELYHVDVRTGAVARATDFPGEPLVSTVYNDAKLDPRGRLWIGARPQAGGPGSGLLYSWDRGREPVVGAPDLWGLNGLAWNASRDRFFLADSRQRVIYAFDFDDESGSLADRRVLVSWEHETARPDGMTVDADEHIWCAGWDAGDVRRYDPSGRLDRTLRVPAIRPTSCAIGGPASDQLWITTAVSPEPKPDDLGGAIFAIDIGALTA